MRLYFYDSSPSVAAEVLAVNEEGNPIFIRNTYGKGHVYYLGFPIECIATAQTYGFQPDKTQPYYKVYQCFALQALDASIIRCENPYLGVTQSKQSDGSYLTAVLNYSDRPIRYDGKLKEGWNMQVLYGAEELISPCDGLIVKCFRCK